jgi:hyperosmotically inducible periplasmic protein
MKKLTMLLITGLILASATACQNPARTSSSAPDNTEQAAEAPDTGTAETNQGDATNDVRQRQIESDIRAREQRNDATGDDAVRADGDLESEVRGKLEANLPASQLAVEAKDGTVKITGTVPTEEQLARIEPLAKEIKGVTVVTVDAKVAPAQAQ